MRTTVTGKMKKAERKRKGQIQWHLMIGFFCVSQETRILYLAKQYFTVTHGYADPCRFY
jgi:hypothetical protein